MSGTDNRLEDLEESVMALAELVTGILGVLSDKQRAKVVEVVAEVRSEFEEMHR